MIFGVVVSIFLVVVIKQGIIVVPEGYEYSLERFGKFLRVLKPGLHIVVPFFDMVGAKLNMKEQMWDFPVVEALTKDENILHIKGALRFQIQDSAKAAYQVRDLTQALSKLIETNIRSQLSKMSKDDFLSQQDAVCYKLRDILDAATVSWGIKVIQIKIWDEAMQSADPFERPADYYTK